MPAAAKNPKLGKALIATKDIHVSSISKYFLSDLLYCLSFGSAPDAKFTLKGSNRVRVLVLDWSLQDKHDSLFKCILEAKKRGDIFVINVFSTPLQKSILKTKQPNIKKNKMMYFISIEFQSISLILTLLKVKKALVQKS